MSVARAVPSLGGYDDEFVNAVEEDLHCVICQLPMKDAVQTGKCGHRFCRQCLDEHFRRLELNRQPFICPVDRNNLIRDKDIFPDKATERKILSFIIRCPSEGCQWTGELRSKDNHLASCPLTVVSCTNKNCSVTPMRNKLQEHVTTTCPWRILSCNFCGVSHPECKKEVHQNECKRFPLNCPQSCGAIIAREEILNHVENSCPLTKVTCPYLWIGCNSEIRREELEFHLHGETRHHLELACCKINNIQDEVKEKTKQLNSLEEKVTSIQREHQKKVSNLENQLEERVKLLQNQLEEREKLLENQLEERVKVHGNIILQERVNIQTEINERLNQNYNEVKKELNTNRWALLLCFAVVVVFVAVLLGLRNHVTVVQSHSETKIEKVEKSLEEQVNHVQSKLELKMDKAQKNIKEKLNGIQSQLETKVGEVHNKLQTQLDKKVDDVQKKMDSLNTELGYKIMLLNAAEPYTFTWKIKSFENVLIQAKSRRQVRIESEPFLMYGYKLKLQLWPNGNGNGQNTHLSLFLVVMKGENDAILTWPFQKKSKLTLIDQQENPVERKNVIFEMNPHPTQVAEYIAEPITNENNGLGYHKFVSHKEIRTRRFVVDDVIFIQLQVGPPP